jgi:hypothetical protein
MKKIYTAFFVLLSISVMSDILDKDGKAGRTGSPGEADCTGCHSSFTVNSGPGSITISSPNLTNWQYVPGQTYQIDVTVAHAGMPLFGFGFEALRTSNNSNGGTLSISNSAETQLKSVSVGGNNRTNVVHKQNGGLSNDVHTFSFNWTAPATNIGNIMFYTAGNAANNQGDTLGDYIYKTSQLVTPFVSGIEENRNESNIKVYPNPATTFIVITSPPDDPVESVQIFNLNGEVIYQYIPEIEMAQLKIQKPENAAGIYLLSCKTKTGTSLRKVLFN